MKRFVASVVLLSAAAVMSIGCDETHTFEFVNRTDYSLQVAYSIAREGKSEVLDGDAYSLAPGDTVHTGETRGRSGDKGSHIFYPGTTLRVQASTDGRVIFDRVYTYQQVKDMDFRVEIVDQGQP